MFCDRAEPPWIQGAAAPRPHGRFLFSACWERADRTSWNLLELDRLRLAVRQRQLQLHASVGSRPDALPHDGGQRELPIHTKAHRSRVRGERLDRKSTRLNSSHITTS